jgi:hypothetical protein
MAGARQRLRELGWERGFGIHRDGHALWNGVDGAWVGGLPAETDPMVLADLGHWHDPLAYARSTSCASGSAAWRAPCVRC